MFFVQEAGKTTLVSTTLQAGDCIRVRPGQGRFCIWRSVERRSWWRPAAVRLWMLDGAGVFQEWLALPPADPADKDDILRRITKRYGVQHFEPPHLSWLEERVFLALDARFDYVAVPRSSR